MYFSNFSFPINIPPIIASKTPTTTYTIATFQPNIDAKSTVDAKSTNGDDIKKLNVTSIGSPAFTKLINIGILEQLQNGVTVPSNAPNVAPFMPFNLLNSLFVFSGVNLLSM